MNMTTEQLKEAGFDIVEGKAVRRGSANPPTARVAKEQEEVARESFHRIAGKPSKYRNTPTTADGWRFDSKKEAKRYEELKLLKQARGIIWFTCQIPFRLPGHTRYVADFLIYWEFGMVTIEDVKSEHTRTLPMYKLKKKLMKETHGIDIVEV